MTTTAPPPGTIVTLKVNAKRAVGGRAEILRREVRGKSPGYVVRRLSPPPAHLPEVIWVMRGEFELVD